MFTYHKHMIQEDFHVYNINFSIVLVVKPIRFKAKVRGIILNIDRAVINIF